VERLASPRSSVPLRTSDPPSRAAALPGSRGAGVWQLAGAGGGGAPLVVALHGAPGSGFDWRYLGAELEARGPVLRVDVPGHGGTARPAAPAPGDASTDAVATLTWALIDAARAEAAPEGTGGPAGAPVVLLAHSFGAELALRLASARPGAVAGVALVAPVGLTPHAASRPVRVTAALAAATRVPLLGALVSRVLWALFVHVYRIGNPRKLGREEVAWCMQRLAARDFGAIARDAARLRAARTPVALFYGEDDALVERAVSEGLAAALGLGDADAGGGAGARARFGVAFAHGGHFLQKTQAGVIAERLSQWLPLAAAWGAGGGGAGAR